MNVTVIIPTYNSELFIREALNSVYAQTSHIHEIICVDDASTDNTASIIKSEFPNVILLRNKNNCGPSFSRNQGIAAATGDTIAFLDADDCWLVDTIHSLKDEFSKDEEIELAAGTTELFYSLQNDNAFPLDAPHFNAYLSSMLIRRGVFNKVGVFNTEMRLSEDQDWFLRVRENKIRVSIIEKIVLQKRIHQANITRQLTFAQSGFIEALRNSVERRRNINDLTDLAPINRVTK